MHTIKLLLQILILTLMLVVANSGFAQDTDALEEITKKVPDSLDRKSTFSGFPYVYYTPETKLAFGAGGIFIYYTGEEENLSPSKINFGGYYSTNKQYKISFSNTSYFLGDKIYFYMPVSYGKFVNKYWGIGENSVDTGNAAYTMKTLSASMTFQVPPVVFQAERTGIILDFDKTDITDKQANHLLYDDSTTIGSDGGWMFGIGSDLLWDTRDNIFFPNSGGYQYFKVIVYPGIGDFSFTLFELDVKHFFAFKKDHVFATNFYFQAATGETPFYKVPAIGGQNRMRGYFFGRYRDNIYMMLQAEYRQYIWKRLGFVVFGGVGNVAHELMAYDFQNLKFSYGGGLRFLFNKKQHVNLRMDIGFGNDGNRGIYFGIEEAF